MSSDAYTLPRDKTESARLEYQHRLITASVGYILHPRVAAALPTDANIADLATGTGIWMRDLANDAETPKTWSFTGLDMSDAQFPADQGFCKYEILNLLDDVPEKWKGAFDAVHLRYLICALSTEQWEVVATNAHALLKPGGWIQWHESDFAHIRILQDVPCAPRRDTINLLVQFQKSHQLHGQINDGDVRGLAKVVESVGFGDVQEDVFASDRDPNVRAGITWNGNRATRSTLLQLSKREPSFPLTEDQVNELGDKAELECAGGKIYHRFDVRIVTAQKSCR